MAHAAKELTAEELLEMQRLKLQPLFCPYTGKRLDKQYVGADGQFRNGGPGKARGTRKDSSGERRCIRVAFTCTPSFLRELRYTAEKVASQIGLVLEVDEENKRESWRRDIVELCSYIGMSVISELDYDLSRVPEELLPKHVVAKLEEVK